MKTTEQAKFLTPDELLKISKTQEFQVGYQVAVGDLLTLLKEQNIKAADISNRFAKAYGHQHATHDFHTQDESGQGQSTADEGTSKEANSVPDEQGLPEGDSTAQSN